MDSASKKLNQLDRFLRDEYIHMKTLQCLFSERKLTDAPFLVVCYNKQRINYIKLPTHKKLRYIWVKTFQTKNT